MTSFGNKKCGLSRGKDVYIMKNIIKFLLETPPEDENNQSEESSMLDYVLGALTISALLILLFVVVPLLFG